MEEKTADGTIIKLSGPYANTELSKFKKTDRQRGFVSQTNPFVTQESELRMKKILL